MRLIDADKLIELPFEKMIHTDFGETAIPIEEIELAPTVTIGEWISEMSIYIKVAMLRSLLKDPDVKKGLRKHV